MMKNWSVSLKNILKCFKRSAKVCVDEELLSILKLVELNPNESMGICANMLAISETGFNYPIDVQYRMAERLTEIFTKWDKYSGNENYPVPGAGYRFMENCKQKALWKGEYGALRRELLDFIIGYLEENNEGRN